MTLAIITRPAAEQDIDRNADYIWASNPPAGRRFYDAVEHSLSRIADFPAIGGLCEFSDPRLAGLRVWPIRGYENFLIYYIPSDAAITVVRVLHGAQDVERILSEQRE